MLWRVPADLKQIHDQGRHFPWPRPECCPRCRNWRVWGHGYVERYFDGFTEALRVKCYRCPACGCVITLRPECHFPRIRSPRQVIRDIFTIASASGIIERNHRGRCLLFFYWDLVPALDSGDLVRPANRLPSFMQRSSAADAP
jgi:hypothetical protein